MTLPAARSAGRLRSLPLTAVAALAMALLLGACSISVGEKSPQAGTSREPSSVPGGALASSEAEPPGGPDTKASGQPNAGGSGRPSAKAPPPPSGPTITTLAVTNIRCNEFTDAGGWIGYVDVKWAIARGDNVQIYGPKSGNFVGGYDAGTTSSTFQLTCEPNTPFLIRAVPQNGSAPGTRRDFTGTWPNSPRTTSITVSRGSCVTGLGDLTVTWTSRGADGVRILVNGTSFPDNASGSRTLTNQTCGVGRSYPVRVTAVKGSVEGGYREAVLTW